MSKWHVITDASDLRSIESHNGGFPCSIALVHEERGVIMSDADFELEDMREFFDSKPNGHVLVAGLGLGIVIDLLLENDVSLISVIEIDSEVIEKTGPKYEDNPRVEIIHDDAKVFNISSLKTPPNYIYLDIWDSCDEYQDRLDLLKKYSSFCENVFIWAMDRSEQIHSKKQKSL